MDAIVAAMQYSGGASVTTTMDVSSGRSVTVQDIAAYVEQQMLIVNKTTHAQVMDIIPHTILSSSRQHAVHITNRMIQWSPGTTPETGIRRLLSWHLDKNVPYGSYSDVFDMKPNSSHALVTENGNDYLFRQKGDVCAKDDLYCLRGKMIYPCMSECASLKQCKPSPYDDIKSLSWSLSAECLTVVYTSFIGKRLNEFNSSAPNLTDQSQSGIKTICSIVFLPKESPVIMETINTITHDQFIQMNVTDRLPSESDADRSSRLLSELNGRLSHTGWTLIWLSNASDLSKVDHSSLWLAPLSPKRLFHPSLKYAMYLADATSLTPGVEDVLFLTSQMWRPAERPQKVQQRIGNKKNKNELILESEPERKVGLLVGALRIAPADDPGSISPWTNKIPWINAVNKMFVEINGDEAVHETEVVRRQRESYERIQGFVNSPQLRPVYSLSYKYDFYHCEYHIICSNLILLLPLLTPNVLPFQFKGQELGGYFMICSMKRVENFDVIGTKNIVHGEVSWINLVLHM